jgi:hypothetical protein
MHGVPLPNVQSSSWGIKLNKSEVLMPLYLNIAELTLFCAGILEQSKGVRNREGI